MSGRTGRRAGFTMVELLTVIAIIAILAAILLPVFFQIQKRVKETQCINNLNQIGQGLKQYRETWGAWPVVIDTMLPDAPAPQVPVKPLFPQFVKSVDIFRCPLSIITNVNDPTWVRPVKRSPNPAGAPVPFQVLRRSSYDGGFVPPRSVTQYELHYATDWTQAAQRGISGFSDQPRQLKFRNPPGDTVVTWCLNHAEFDAQGNCSGNVLVLFEDGTVKKARGDRFSFSRWTGANGMPQPGSHWLVNKN